MKNEHQENGVLRGPLILMVPASNLVAVMSLDWLGRFNRAALSTKTHGWNYLANRPRTPKDFGELSRAARGVERSGALDELADKQSEPVPPNALLFGRGIPRSSLPRASRAKLTSAPLRF
jgi:hypothetical protein